ncbi:MAG: hypothetical protein KDA24_22255 [Deltaproteobacteria bacterium]|nr:hypothetical protein [Deltaproteobacteria bacterium]
MNTLIAVVARGLEDVAAKEIRALGGGIGKTRKDRGRVFFQGPADAVYRANLQLRTVDRVLVPLGDKPFEATSSLALTRAAREMAWEEWVTPGQTLRVAASAKACRLYHTGAIADAIKEALVYRGIPTEEEGDQPVTVDLRGTADRWTLAVDSSGPSLHRRGYRKATAMAPLKETFAAAALLKVGYTGEEPLLDPMCGSGTFVGEAALIASRRPPGLDRSFAFENWPSFDPEMWQKVVGRVGGAMRPLPAAVEGADSAATAVKAAKGNLRRAEVDGVRILKRRIQDTPPAKGPGIVIMNPPYGKRVGPGTAIDAARGEWRAWANLLRERRPDAQIYALSPAEVLAEAAGAIGRPVLRFSNGGIPVALVKLQ